MARRDPHPQLPLLGARLKLVRGAARWTQEQLATAIGVTPQVISQYENGKSSLRISTVLNMAAALRVGVGQLLDVDLPMPTASPPPEASEIIGYYLRLGDADRALAVQLVRDVAIARGS